MFKRRKSLVVLIATPLAGVLPALLDAAQHLQQVALERREALSVSGAYAHLSGAHLAVIDPETLAGADGEHAQLNAALAGARGLVVVRGAEFLEDPTGCLERAAAAGGLGEMLPPRTVACTSLAGGVGKTTLALATARAFHAATRLPAAVIELSPGASALYALTGVEGGASLYEVVEQGATFPVWEGVTLAGMDWSLARLLEPDRVRAVWTALARQHIFVACDAPAWHPLFTHLPASHYLVLADGRVDALSAALTLRETLFRQEALVEILLNRAGLAGRVGLPVKPALELPGLRDPWNAGPLVLKAIYPGAGKR